MGHLTRRSRWLGQPSQIVLIDFASEFGVSLVGGFSASNGALRSFSRKAPSLTRSLPTAVATSYKLAYPFNGTSHQISIPGVDLSSTAPAENSGVTITSILFGGSQNGRMLFEQSVSTDTNDGFYIYGITSSALRFELNTASASAISKDINYILPTVPTVVQFIIDSTSSPAAVSILENGVLKASDTIVTAGYFANDTVYVGSRAGTSLFANQTFGDTFIHAGAMTLDEARRFAANPWQALVPQRRRLISLPVTSDVTGTGSLISSDAQVSGTGISLSTGTGTLVDQPAAAAGSGVSTSAGTGTLDSSAVVVSGTGISQSTGTGALVDSSAQASGSGVSASVGTGAIVSQSSAVSGTAVDVVSGTGTLASQGAILAGAGISESSGVASLLTGSSIVLGAGVSLSSGLGSLIVGSSLVFGESLGTRAIHVQRDPAMLVKGEPFTLMLVMLSASDHLTGMPGLTIAVRLGKAGGVLGLVSRTVNDRGSGIYTVELTAADTDTEGELLVLASAEGADNSICAVQVTDDLLTDQQVFLDVIKALVVYL